MKHLGLNYPDTNTLHDGKVDVSSQCPQKFPWYINRPEFLFIPQHCFTVPDAIINPTTAKFIFADNKPNLDKNLKIMGPDWHYATKEVIYTRNRNGYRAPEWDQVDWRESIVVIGCSMTYGVGVSEDETLSHYLNLLQGRPVINLGYPSCSNEVIVHNLATLMLKCPAPYAVIVNWTTLDRFAFWGKDHIAMGPWTQKNEIDDDVPLADLFKWRNYSEKNKYVENYFLSRHAAAICAGRTRYISMSYFAWSAHYMRADIYCEQPRDMHLNARDTIHPGPGCHHTAAIEINKLLHKL